MNAFTNLFFSQQAQQADPHSFDETDERYAGYGNRIASARFFPRLGHVRAKRSDDKDFHLDADLAVGGCG